MSALDLTQEVIDKASKEAVEGAKRVMKSDLVEAILYGSCARGDFHADSDIDIALITKCGRTEIDKYNDALAWVATEIIAKYLSAIVNFACIPEDEYREKKRWYFYYKNIDVEGKIIYG
ncbi:MAG: nucleotidyltransferase domain-containing protein [Lachnospiraceae bacterium]|nr:nucleotidyltransferase domain-containing protein [Lachnospiraceae bacterium]